jgi:phage gp29-like protein
MAARRRSKHNTAPPAAGTSPLVTSAEALRTVRQNKWNPLRQLTPDMLSRVLEAFDHGYLVEAVLLWEKIAERDDVIASVKPKREKDVSQLDMQVVVADPTDPAAAAHKETLEEFWRNVRCINSYDRNERGGFRRLVKQMMTAVSYRYAAHHIIWEPRPDGTLRATFEYVPLWMFENRTGSLRYLKSPSAQSGELLTDGEWMVTTGDGLMISCCIGYLAKRSAFNDWLIFSEKFSVPGVLGRTTGKKGSPEAEAMRAAVESFGHDWVAVVYGDDGTHAEPIKLVQAQGNPSAMPMPAVIERVDRKFAALYRGADLSSMSSGSGEGTGASLQEKETDILRRDDAEMISETLADVSRMVIEWHYGHGTEPLARVELVVPVQEDSEKVIRSGLALAGAGASVSMSALMDRAGIPAAKEASDRLGGNLNRQDAKSAKGETVANADYKSFADFMKAARPARGRVGDNADGDSATDDPPAWLAAFSGDMKPLGQALESAMAAGDDAAMRAALKKISARMPDLMETAGFEAYLEDQFIAALAGEDEEVANGDFQGHPFRGNQYKYGRGREGESAGFKTDVFGRIPGNDDEYLSPRDNMERAKKAVAWAFRSGSPVRGVVWRKGLGKVDLPSGRPGVKRADWKRGEGIQHIAAKHEADVFRMAETLAMGKITLTYRADGSIDKSKRTLSHARGGSRFLAILVKREDEKNSWILTHYEDD